MGASRRSWARWTCLVLIATAAVAMVPSPADASPEDDLEAAQERANQAAGELAGAEEDLALTQDAVAHLETRVATVDARVGAAREQVRALAIRLYVEGTVPVVRILRMADANQVIRAQQYSQVIAGGSTDSLQQYRAEMEDLRQEQTDLDEQRASQAASLQDLEDRRTDAVAELDRLSEVVARVNAAREAERQAAAAANGSGSAFTSSERSAASTLSPGTGTGTGAVTPEPPAAEPGVAPDWICPVQGPHAFSNDYGAPRGGGYTHQGNDILAPRGTPVVASVDGEVRQRTGAVSGLAYYLEGDDGTEYFGAHLDSFGASGRVTAGTVVGMVGNTGDAASTAPHLHFEIHPGGNGNINPFPTLSVYC